MGGIDTTSYSVSQRLIGVLEGWWRPRGREVEILAEAARLNKLYLAYLRRVNDPALDIERMREEARYRRYTGNVIEVVKTLNDLRYALHKFRKPFEHVSVDLDILIHVDDAPRAVRRLVEKGFRIVVPESYTVTLEKRGFIVDLYTQPSFAWIVYLNGKELLKEHVEDFEVEGVWVRGLTRDAEVVVSAAHAVYKEHIALLIDCLTLWKWCGRKALDIAVELGVYDSMKMLSSACREVLRGAEAPVKIHPAVLLKAYLRKVLEDPAFRATSPNIVKYLAKRREIGRIILWRLLRKTY